VRVSQYSHFIPAEAARALDFDSLVEIGQVIDVSGGLARAFAGGRIGIEAGTYERYVAWDNHAMRRHSLHLETSQRLHALLEASAFAAVAQQDASFVCRTVDATSNDPRAQRAIFNLKRLSAGARTGWVITLDSP
jgi:hypothetical protein